MMLWSKGLILRIQKQDKLAVQLLGAHSFCYKVLITEIIQKFNEITKWISNSEANSEIFILTG